ncbi:immune inhibitor A, partial [bacterium]|nr:immune inhibitor A [bacterium]
SLTHELRIQDLTPCTIYYYVIKLIYDVGNEETFNDNGEPYIFETRMDKAVGLTHLSNDFEGGELDLWSHGAAADKLDEWELGYPEDGPLSTHSGDNCWGIDLDGNYDAGNDSWLVTPEIDLTESFNPKLMFWHWYEIFVDHNSGDDGAWIEVSSNGINWTHIDPDGGYPESLDPDAPYNPSRETEDLIGVYAGKTENWEEAAFSLKDFRGQKIQIRFHFWQDSGDNKELLAGWYIDDVRVFDDNYGICHRGDLQFLSDNPNCSFPLPLYLGDNDLNLNPEVKETYDLSVVISSNPIPIPLTLTESGIDTGVFFGSLIFSNDGIQVEPLDQLNTEYLDENPGTEGQRLNSISAVISCVTTPARTFVGRDVADDNGGEVDLYWEPSPDDSRNENDVKIYILYRADVDISGLFDFEPIQQLQPRTRTTRDTNATPPKEYYYLLETVDLYGNTARTQRVGPITGADNIPPEPPSNLRAMDLGKGNSVLLEWDHQRTYQGDGYIILYDTKPGWPYNGKGADLGDSPIQVGLTNSVVISGLQTDKEYYFAVRATEYTGARSLMSEEASSIPTSVNLPIILAAGFDESFVEYSGEVYVQALVQRGLNPLDKVKVFYKGNDTGLELTELWNQDSTALYGGTLLVEPPDDYKDKIFIELSAFDDKGYGSVMWPYLEVPGTQENNDLPDRVQFNWGEDFTGSQTDLTNGPRIIFGGYWDTKIDPGNAVNTLKMKVLVTHPDGLNSIDSVGFFYGNEMTNFRFNDNGLDDDGQGGEGIYSIQLELANYPEPGNYILTVVAKDIYGNMSNIFPYLHIVI